MKSYIPVEKMSKKAQRELNKARRTTWGAISPVTRKPPNPKAYNRKNTRRQTDIGDGYYFCREGMLDALPGKCAPGG